MRSSNIYDIVYFDQRGIGLSNPLACPNAYKANFMDYLNASDKAGKEGYDTPKNNKKPLTMPHIRGKMCCRDRH